MVNLGMAWMYSNQLLRGFDSGWKDVVIPLMCVNNILIFYGYFKCPSSRWYGCFMEYHHGFVMMIYVFLKIQGIQSLVHDYVLSFILSKVSLTDSFLYQCWENYHMPTFRRLAYDNYHFGLSIFSLWKSIAGLSWMIVYFI